MTETLEAMDLLDLRLCDCHGPLERGIVRRAILHLETSLPVHPTGAHADPAVPLEVADAC